jgi:chromosome segregation ATPase
MKIKFTPEHMTKLKELAAQALFGGIVVRTKLGQPLNIYQLIHTTSINQLNEIKNGLVKQIEKIENGDEWTNPDNEKLDDLKSLKEMTNLIIGWKRYNLELNENARKKEELSKKLTELKESTKTPEDRIKELEAQLKELEEF